MRIRDVTVGMMQEMTTQGIDHIRFVWWFIEPVDWDVIDKAIKLMNMKT